MKKNVIVSLADSNYFELLNELVDSIKSFEQSKDTAICILDAGLTEQQRNDLSLPEILLHFFSFIVCLQDHHCHDFHHLKFSVYKFFDN